MARSRAERHRVKVSVTVDPDLLKAVDSFVEEHADADRSKVFDEALYLWYARQQDAAMEAQFAAPQSEEERREYEDWRVIRRAAAARLFQSQ